MTIYDLDDARQQQALGQVVQGIRLAASSRKSYSLKAVEILEMNADRLIEAWEEAGAPGLPDGFGGDGRALAAYIQNLFVES